MMASAGLSPLPGTDWIDAGLSVGIFCGLRATGEIACSPPQLSCGNTSTSPCVGPNLPSFLGGPYQSITATSSAVCALDNRGALTCQRYDGADMLADPGPYTFAEGGQSVVCAIRTNGSVACFRHAGDAAVLVADPGPFVPVNLGFGPEW